MARILVQQVDDSNEHVIYYINKTLDIPTLKYTHDKKLKLAIIISMQNLLHYILPRKTMVFTDSNPMLYILSRCLINNKFAQWIIIP